MCRPARLQVCKGGTDFYSNSFHPLSQRAVGMKNSNQLSEEWRSAVSSQQSARKRSRSGDRSYKKSRQPSAVRKRSRSGDRSYKKSGLRVRFHVDSSNLYSFSPGAVRNADRIWSSTPQNRTYRTWGNGLSAIWMVLICVSLDSRFFVLVGFNDGCEEVLTELCGEDAVDFCRHYPAISVSLLK